MIAGPDAEPAVHPALLAAAVDGLNVCLTPHSAFYSIEAFEEMRWSASKEILRGLGLVDEAPLYKVN